MSTQVSQVSSQISHVNTTVMRLADQTAQLTQKEFQKESTLTEIAKIQKQNQLQLQRIEAQLQQVLTILQLGSMIFIHNHTLRYKNVTNVKLKKDNLDPRLKPEQLRKLLAQAQSQNQDSNPLNN